MAALAGLRAVVETALGAGVPVINAHQPEAGAPRPLPKPYATVQITNSQALSSTPYKALNDTGSGSPTVFERTISHSREATGVVDYFGTGAVGALEALQLKLSRGDVQATARVNGVRLARLGPVLRVPDLRNTSWDEHAQVDFRVRHVLTDIQDIAAIEAVKLMLEISPAGDIAVFPELLADGDMELAGTVDWLPMFSPVLTKETLDPFEGLRSLRVTRDGVNNPAAVQNVLTAGKLYRTTGWAKTDGNAGYRIFLGTGTLDFDAPPTVGWTRFDFTGVADNVSFALQAVTSTGTEWAEFDLVSVKETDALEVLEITHP